MSAIEVESRSLRVLIADRHEVSRGAIRALLQTEGLDVVADVATVDEALAAAGRHPLDIAIVDLRPQDVAGLALARSLARLTASSPLVVLASSSPIDEAASDGLPFLAKADICAEQLRRLVETHKQHDKESRVSLQAYHDNIITKTGKTPEELVEVAHRKGLTERGVKPNQVIAWLKDEYDLGHGHAMAVVAAIKKQTTPERSTDEKVSRHFAGRKAGWRSVYDKLVQSSRGFGPDTDVAPGASYLSLRKAGKKFAIVQVTTERLDLGLKLKGVAAAGRLESAGSWNAMVTHRVRIHSPDDVDQELLGWLEQAYATA
jgi:DNA-binding NarL/FixJ family response regulator